MAVGGEDVDVSGALLPSIGSGDPFRTYVPRGNSQPLVRRWQWRGECAGKSQSVLKTGRSSCWSCSETVTLWPLCPQSPVCCNLPIQARALFSSFSFCCINLQLLLYLFRRNYLLLVKIYLSYSLDHLSPSLPMKPLQVTLQVKYCPLP